MKKRFAAPRPFSPATGSSLRTACVELMLGCLALSVPSVRGQGIEEARDAYLLQIGAEQNAIDIEDYLFDELQSRGWPDASRLAEFFSFVMAIHGLDGQKVARLNAGGVNVLHSITSNARPFTEQGLYSDLAVSAEVLEVRDLDLSEGNRSTIVVRVLETQMGRAPGDTLYLSQRRRRTDQTVADRTELRPEIGDHYLLLLSRPMYDFFRARRAARAAAGSGGGVELSADPRWHAIYRFYRLDENRVIMGDGSSRPADRVFQELRWLDELIENL